VRRAADNPVAGRGDDGAAGACELPGAIPDQERDTSNALAGAGQESARCRRAPQSHDRSPSRPAVKWRVARMLGFDGGTPRPCPRINAAGTEAADSATPAPRTSVTNRERRRSCIQVRRTLNDAPMLRQVFGATFICVISGVLPGGWIQGLSCCGQDREGPLAVEGKLLLGHDQQAIGPGTAGESLAGQQHAAAD
jgi:hypothetical protein